MCLLFKSQDPATYGSETRPIRLHGHSTSIRLEAAFWDILEEIAGREGVPVSRFCAILHDEMTQRHGDVSNFASLLRVTCLHYMRHKDVYLTQLSEAKKPALS
jgi:predicted DNA-binding ribbon-helix-helix protein